VNCSWRELRAVCLLLGCRDGRKKGDHLVMTRAGMARPVVIKMDNDLGEDLIRSNLRTLGLSVKEFQTYLKKVRGGKKVSRKK
jgi:hypothetical protein